MTEDFGLSPVMSDGSGRSETCCMNTYTKDRYVLT